MASSRNIKISEDIDLDYMLGNLPIQLRQKAFSAAINSACRVVVREAKRRVPIGDKSHNPQTKTLVDTITHVVRKYNDGRTLLGIVGPGYPVGAHGHLIEDGHDVKVSRGQRKGKSPLSGKDRVEAKKYLAPAVDTTQSKQDDAIINTIQRYIKKAGG